MKRITLVLVLLLLTGSAFATQNSNMKPAKKSNSNAAAKKPAAVDCSKMTDDQITAEVKDKLSKTKSLKDATIDVATSAGVVILTGKVKTGALKGVATNQAKGVGCVKRVENRIMMIKSAGDSTPSGPNPPRNNNKMQKNSTKST